MGQGERAGDEREKMLSRKHLRGNVIWHTQAQALGTEGDVSYSQAGQGQGAGAGAGTGDTQTTYMYCCRPEMSGDLIAFSWMKYLRIWKTSQIRTFMIMTLNQKPCLLPLLFSG